MKTINDQPVTQFLQFWRHIAPPQTTPEVMATAWPASVEAALGDLPIEVLEPLASEYQRAYDEVESTRSSVDGRANSLMLFTGVVGGISTLAATALSGAPILVAAVFLIVGGCLSFFAVGTLVLSIRAQQVGVVSRSDIAHGSVVDRRSFALRRAVEARVAGKRNALVVADKVGYLRDAQTYAQIALVFVVLLSGVAWLAAVTGMPAGSGLASSVTPQPTVTDQPATSAAAGTAGPTLSPTSPVQIPSSSSDGPSLASPSETQSSVGPTPS